MQLIFLHIIREDSTYWCWHSLKDGCTKPKSVQETVNINTNETMPGCSQWLCDDTWILIIICTTILFRHSLHMDHIDLLAEMTDASSLYHSPEHYIKTYITTVSFAHLDDPTTKMPGIAFKWVCIVFFYGSLNGQWKSVVPDIRFHFISKCVQVIKKTSLD